MVNMWYTGSRPTGGASQPPHSPTTVPMVGRSGQHAHRTRLPAASVVPPSHSWLAAVRSLQQ